MLKKTLISYRDVILLSLLAIFIGAIVGFIDTLFGRVLLWISDIRMEHTHWFLPFLGIAGVLIIYGYQQFGGESQKGMTLIFEMGHGLRSKIPLRLIPFTIIGTWLTHLFGGSAGREGVAIQIGATFSHQFSRIFPIKNGSKILLITGIAAGFAGLFGTPIAATFFALEVLTVGKLEQEALLPAFVGSFTASFVSKFCGLERFTFTLNDTIDFSFSLLPKLFILSIAFGVVGGLFSFCLHKTKALINHQIPNPYLRIFLIGILISTVSLLAWDGRYSGLGTNLISMSFNKGIYSWDFALKLLFTVITLSAGFQGGEVTPLFSIGSSLGVVLASLLGLPVSLSAALGYCAVFGSATNTFLAPMIIGAEVFGAEYLPYFAVVCSLSYVFNGNLSIYTLQKK